MTASAPTTSIGSQPECPSGPDWPRPSKFIEVVDTYIRWYNEKRIKISLGSRSPIKYRVSLGLAA
jgi:hypothetical protein